MIWIYNLKTGQVLEASSTKEKEKIYLSGGTYVTFDHDPTKEELDHYKGW